MSENVVYGVITYRVETLLALDKDDYYIILVKEKFIFST